ncbi:MAG: type II and III secretion system protein family protein [Parvibaculum sp.]|uniref:type II and III secretion system protein family protein n=1 Tax=Parvibaculum sp. TaxID=2024848 RepID=UPI00284F97FB|nr:type II and III secretion system protein family protein [Parvibaculum sp.]MDR3500038.1 type II and III secretion system protein family protein [Parvibaculum sp.]
MTVQFARSAVAGMLTPARRRLKVLLRASLGLLIAFAPTAPAFAVTGDAPLVKIDQGGIDRTSRSIVLGLSKAAVVELPVAARDVLVSDPAVVNAVVRTAKRTYLIGLAVGQTNAFFFDEKGRQILNLEIRVERDLSGLRSALHQYFPDSNIDVQAMNDHVVLSGAVANAAEADKARDLAARYIGKPEQVLNMLSIDGKEQVMLKVTVAEMQRNVIKQLGVNLSTADDIGNFALRLSTLNPFSIQGAAIGGLSSTAPNQTTGVTQASGFNTSKTSIQGAIQALEENGLVRTLAEPTLTAISGENAKFLAGGEFPIPVSKDLQGNITVQYKPFGVGLAFTPVVMSEGRISLKISTEVSELTTTGAIQSQGLSIPGLHVRRAETTLELPSGGSLVMAGLLSDQTKQNIDGVPGAKDLPVLGALFRSRDYQKNETELVVIVTPYIVDPTNRKNIALPTDGYAPASDLDTVLMGKLNATYGVNRDAPIDRKLEGPVGFVVD